MAPAAFSQMSESFGRATKETGYVVRDARVLAIQRCFAKERFERLEDECDGKRDED